MDNNVEIGKGKTGPFVSPEVAAQVRRGLGDNGEKGFGEKIGEILYWLKNYKKDRIKDLVNKKQQLSEATPNEKQTVTTQEVATLAEKYSKDRSGISKATESQLSAFQQDTAKEIGRFTLPDSMNKAA